MTEKKDAIGRRTRVASKQYTNVHPTQYLETTHVAPAMTFGRRFREAEIAKATRAEALSLARHHLRDAVSAGVTDTINWLRHNYAEFPLAYGRGLPEHYAMGPRRRCHWGAILRSCISDRLMPGLAAAFKAHPSIASERYYYRVRLLLADIKAVELAARALPNRDANLFGLYQPMHRVLDAVDQLVADVLWRVRSPDVSSRVGL